MMTTTTRLLTAEATALIRAAEDDARLEREAHAATAATIARAEDADDVAREATVRRGRKAAAPTVTVLPMTAAAKRATSPVKISKATKATTKAMRATTKVDELETRARKQMMKPADASPKAVKKVTVAKPDAKPAAKRATFTSVDLAAEKGIDAKTLRARIRRNIAKWEPLFAGEKHTFKDNTTTRKAIEALLAAS